MSEFLNKTKQRPSKERRRRVARRRRRGGSGGAMQRCLQVPCNSTTVRGAAQRGAASQLVLTLHSTIVRKLSCQRNIRSVGPSAAVHAPTAAKAHHRRRLRLENTPRQAVNRRADARYP